MGNQWGDLIEMRMLGECLADAKKNRMAAENRALRGGTTRTQRQGDSELVKLAIEAQQARIIGPPTRMEKEFRDELLDAYRTEVPDKVREWFAGIPGLGDGVLPARIIAAIGHPRLATPYVWGTDERGRPAPVPAGDPFERTPRQLLQFCGCGDPDTNPRGDILGHSPTREDMLRGGKRTTVRPLLFTFTAYLVRMHKTNPKVAESEYYQFFVEVKERAKQNRHRRQCQNKVRPPLAPNGCGTHLHPEWGEPGSLWRPGHVNMHAHRLTQKHLLKNLWEISGRV